MASLSLTYFHQGYSIPMLMVMMIRVSFDGAWPMIMVEASAWLAI